LTVHHRLELEVRFREVDAYGIVWHGHYFDWMESARHRYAAAFGFDIADWQRRGIRAPMLECHVEFRQPARFGDTVAIAVCLAEEPRRAIAFDYRIERAGPLPILLARGRTVQVLQDDGGLLLRWPVEIDRILDRMRADQAGRPDTAD